MSVFAGVALADDESVNVTNIRISPSSLPGDGQIAVTVNVAVDINRAEGGISNVAIDGAGVVKPAPAVGQIQVGDNQDVSCTLNVQASQLGMDIPLSVTWDGGSASFSVKVDSSAPSVPQVSFTRTVDKTSVEKGGTVTLTYRVENTGTVDIANLAISDAGISQDALQTKSSLPAGSSFEFTYAYSIDADFTSEPKLTYSAGGTAYSATCPAKSVTLRVAELDAMLESSPDTINSGDQTLLQCTVTNAGNIKLSSITVSDDTLGKSLFPSFSMEAGAPTKYFTRNVSLTQTTKFQFVLSAKDDEGKTYTFKSNEIEVKVSSASGQYDIGIAAEPDAIRLSEPGKVNFSFTVDNRGADPVPNVSVTDQDGKAVHTFGSLPAGETKFTYQTAISKTEQFNFCLTVPNGDGAAYQVYTGPMKIEVADATTAPPATLQPTDASSPSGTEATEASAPSGSQGRMGSLITALLVIGVLIVVTIVILIAMIASDKKRRRRY